MSDEKYTTTCASLHDETMCLATVVCDEQWVNWTWSCGSDDDRNHWDVFGFDDSFLLHLEEIQVPVIVISYGLGFADDQKEAVSTETYTLVFCLELVVKQPRAHPGLKAIAKPHPLDCLPHDVVGKDSGIIDLSVVPTLDGCNPFDDASMRTQFSYDSLALLQRLTVQCPHKVPFSSVFAPNGRFERVYTGQDLDFWTYASNVVGVVAYLVENAVYRAVVGLEFLGPAHRSASVLGRAPPEDAQGWID